MVDEGKCNGQLVFDLFPSRTSYYPMVKNCRRDFIENEDLNMGPRRMNVK